MKYMVMMNTMKAGEGVPVWPKEDLQTHIAFMMGLNRELHERGELVSAEGLSFPNQAKLVRAGKVAGRSLTESFPSRRSFSPVSGSSMSTVQSGRMPLPRESRLRQAPEAPR